MMILALSQKGKGCGSKTARGERQNHKKTSGQKSDHSLVIFKERGRGQTQSRISEETKERGKKLKPKTSRATALQLALNKS